MSKNVLIVNGSLRNASFNKSVYNVAKEALENKGVTVTEMVIADLPLMSQDIEFPAPEAVARVREQLIAADALFIVSPEYNGSVPGGLKNMLDWVSRPVAQGTFGAPEFVSGKPVAIASASGTASSLLIAELTGLLTRMAMAPVSTTAGLKIPGEAFMTGEYVVADEQKEAVIAVVDALVATLNA